MKAFVLLVLVVAAVLYSAASASERNGAIVSKALEISEAKAFLGRHPSASPYVLSLASGGFSNALSGMDAFFARYEADPLVRAARNNSASFRGSSSLYVVSLSPNPPVKRDGWIAPHPDRPVLFLFFSGTDFLFAYESV